MGLFVEDKFYRVKEVAQILGVSEVTVRRWIKDGALTAHIIGGTLLIHTNDILTSMRNAMTKRNR